MIVLVNRFANLLPTCPQAPFYTSPLRTKNRHYTPAGDFRYSEGVFWVCCLKNVVK